MHMIGCVFVAVLGFNYFALLNTKLPALIFVAVALSGLPIRTMYGPDATLIAQSLSPRLRYTGSSLGYQLASVIAGGPSPFIATALLAFLRFELSELPSTSWAARLSESPRRRCLRTTPTKISRRNTTKIHPARRLLLRRCLPPFSRASPIALYFRGRGVIGLVSVSLLTDYTNKDVSQEHEGVYAGTTAPEQHKSASTLRGGNLMISTRIAVSPLSEVEHSRQLGRAVVASTVGTIIEAYDFLLYVLVAPLVFAKLYFPESDPLVGTLQAFGSYAVGFVARPVGAALFGHYGDRIGRKTTLRVSVSAANGAARP